MYLHKHTQCPIGTDIGHVIYPIAYIRTYPSISTGTKNCVPATEHELYFESATVS
jgi:hypothetical protein